MAAFRCDGSEFASRWPRSCHKNLLGILCRAILCFHFPACTGIDNASYGHELKHVIEAALIARETPPNFVGPPFASFLDEIGICY
jgi:hypothetical protein